MIYDLDDDNELIDDDINVLSSLTPASLAVNANHIVYTDAAWHHLHNPYPEFAPNEVSMWPRGFPLDAIRDNRTYALPMEKWNSRRRDGQIGLLQLLADKDPDVDAIYRLTQGVPVTFTKRDGVTVIPRGTMTPCNGQALVAFESAFWGLLLPITVHGEIPTSHISAVRLLSHEMHLCSVLQAVSLTFGGRTSPNGSCGIWIFTSPFTGLS